MDHRSLAGAVGESENNFRAVSPCGLITFSIWVPTRQPGTHPLTSDFFFSKKKYMDDHHTFPASSQAAFQPRGSSLKFFDPRENSTSSCGLLQHACRTMRCCMHVSVRSHARDEEWTVLKKSGMDQKQSKTNQITLVDVFTSCREAHT